MFLPLEHELLIRRLRVVGCLIHFGHHRPIPISNLQFDLLRVPGGASRDIPAIASQGQGGLVPALGDGSGGSRFIAAVDELEPELPAFECRQHAAELLPGDFLAVDY